MAAALRIVSEVLAYRLKRLEMANLVGAVAIMLTLRLPLADIIFRTAFAFVLNLLAYTTNDYYDVERDLAAGRAREKAAFLIANRRAALWAQLALAAMLLVAALAYEPELVVSAVAGAGICWIYSARLKAKPYLDVVAMTLWGVAMPLVAIPLDSLLGWCLVIQLGLFSSCFETIQVLRDLPEDRDAKLDTTAVRLGPRRALVLARLLMFVAAGYAICVLERFAGILLVAAVFLPFAPDAIERFWNRVRLMLGLGWLATLGSIYLKGETSGLFVRVARDQQLF
jgi:4-hydroxybenzoate polyprenyltransferase